MKSLISMFTSSIGRKVVMALTGLFLCTFLVVHLLGNLQLLLPAEKAAQKFNEYSKFMTTNPVIKTTSYLLYASILLHALQGFLLTMTNRMARPVQYHSSGANENSSWYSRNMALLGSVLLAFIIGHMAMFWFKYHFGTIGEVSYVIDGQAQSFKDMYSVVSIAFSEWWMVALYVVSMGALGFHLLHGFKSAFQSLGLNHVKYNGIISALGVFMGVIVPILFAIIPIFMLAIS